MPINVTQLRVGEDPELQNTLKNASYQGGRAANCFNYSPTKKMAVYGLYGPAQAKQINYERRQTHTYYDKWPLGPRGSLLPCELKCPSNRSVLPTAPA